MNKKPGDRAFAPVAGQRVPERDDWCWFADYLAPKR